MLNKDSVFLKEWDQETGLKCKHKKLSEDLNTFNLGSVKSHRQQN